MRAICLFLALVSGAALVPVSAEVATTRFQLNIARELLAAALADLAQQTGLQIAGFSDTINSDAMVGPLDGEMSVDQALQLLLSGQPLTYQIINQRTIAITPAAAPPSAAMGRRVSYLAAAGTMPATPGSGAETPHATDGATAAATLSDVVVTATRREEQLSRVPQSIAAFTAETMQDLGIKSIADVKAFSPGLTFHQTGWGFTTVAIRGIQSDIGSSTTGIYLDDTPIQVRAVGYASENAHPRVFDLERIEVLRGPQGTLFGAGSEGGTVRYITPKPDLVNFSGMTRAELSSTPGGDPSYEVGAAIGGPLVADQLGFRLSGWYRDEGGYIDRVDRVTGTLVDRNLNSSESRVARLALTWAPNERLKITPSIYYQRHQSDHANEWWESYSEPSAGRFATATNVPATRDDEWKLYDLAVSYDFDSMRLVSATSYFDRQWLQTIDYSFLFTTAFTGAPFIPDLPDYTVASFFTNDQENVTQEVRLSSTDAGSRWNWTVGLFYSDLKQDSRQLMYDPDMPQFINAIWGIPLEWAFGVGLYQDAYSVHFLNRTKETQLAGFGELRYEITEQLSLTVGLRASRTRFSYKFTGDGPLNRGHSESSGSIEESPVTQKVSLSYQRTDEQLFYATAAKGYRIGGANNPISVSACAQDLQNYGLDRTPDSYGADHLWNYEIGSKSRLFGGRAQLDFSAYYIKWSDIQQNIYFPLCAFNFIANLNKATSKGFDLQGAVRVSDRLTLMLAAGYTDAAYTSDTSMGVDATGAPRILFAKGDPLNVAPWNVSVGARYDFPFLGNPAYFRADHAWSDSYLLGAGPRAAGYYAPARPVEAVHSVKLRAAVELSHWEIAAFVDNATNAHPQMMRAHVSHSYGYTPDYLGVTARPRTFGVTSSYRF